MRLILTFGHSSLLWQSWASQSWGYSFFFLYSVLYRLSSAWSIFPSITHFLASSCLLFSSLDSTSETNSHFHPLPSNQSEELLQIIGILNLLSCVLNVYGTVIIPCLSLDGLGDECCMLLFLSDSVYFLYKVFWLRILSSVFIPLSQFRVYARMVSFVIDFCFVFVFLSIVPIYLFILCMPVSVCVWACTYHGVVWCGDREQLAGVCFLLPHCGSQE